MKRAYSLSLAIFILTALTAATSDHFLIPENFFLQKGQKLNVRLFNSIRSGETNYEEPSTQPMVFSLYEGSKVTQLSAKNDSGKVAIKNHQMVNQGLALLQLKQTNIVRDVDKNEFAERLDEDGQTEMAEKVKDRNGFRVKEKFSQYLKTLVLVDKNSGNVHEKVIGDEYEIVLKTNPYKQNYGDDITAVIYFRNKPAIAESVRLYVKTATGNVHTQNLSSDQQGQVYIKLSREGIYLLCAVRTEPVTNNDADFETYMTSFTFAFSSENALPNTYKEFGFGDVH